MLKKLTLMLVALTLLLVSCGTMPDMDYCNFDKGCRLGSSVYMWRGMKIISFNTAAGGPRSLCYDPLCTHEGGDICLENENVFVFDIKTDGEKLYIDLQDLGESFGKTSFIYAFDVKNGTLEKLVEFNGYSSRIDYSDGYIYYKEQIYDESRDNSEQNNGLENTLSRFMRIKTSGGKPERLFDEDYSSDTSFFVDSQNYYIISESMTVVDRFSGAQRTV